MESIGDRIAVQRRRRGLSQSQLAGLVGMSTDYIGKIERGDRMVDRLSTLIPIAEVLQVPVSELTGEPPPLARDPAEQHAVVQAVRLALTGHHFLDVMLKPPGSDGIGTGDLPRLRESARTAWQLTHGSDYDGLAKLLPDLLYECERAARLCRTEQQAEGFETLAIAYQAAAAAMAQVGETDVAWVAADRSVFAAERAADPLLAAAGDFRLGHAFLAGGKVDQAERAASVAADALGHRLNQDGHEVLSLFGGLQLIIAIAAARRNDAVAAEGALSRATDAAERLGRDENEFDTEFGPTNVSLHRVSVAVELGKSGAALQLARDVDPRQLSPERRGRYWIDVARAYAQRGDVANALSTLLDADAVTPELVHHHIIVRETVIHLMRRGHARVEPELVGLAKRMGVVA